MKREQLETIQKQRELANFLRIWVDLILQAMEKEKKGKR